MATIDQKSKVLAKDSKPVYIPSDFDLRKVEHRDRKTGRVIRTNNYRLRIVNKYQFVEWPVNSGNLYHVAGDGAGRIEEGTVYLNKSHVEYNAPLTQDEKISRENANLKQEMIRLEKEIAEIKNEQEMKAFKDQIEAKEPNAKGKVNGNRGSIEANTDTSK